MCIFGRIRRMVGARPGVGQGVAQPEPRDEALLHLLQARDGRLTYVLLADGRRLPVYDIAWGYDMGDEYANVTTNCSPG